MDADVNRSARGRVRLTPSPQLDPILVELHGCGRGTSRATAGSIGDAWHLARMAKKRVTSALGRSRYRWHRTLCELRQPLADRRIGLLATLASSAPRARSLSQTRKRCASRMPNASVDVRDRSLVAKCELRCRMRCVASCQRAQSPDAVRPCARKRGAVGRISVEGDRTARLGSARMSSAFKGLTPR